MVNQVGHPESDGEEHQKKGFFLHLRPWTHFLEFVAKEFRSSIQCRVLRRVKPYDQAPDAKYRHDSARQESQEP